MRYALCLALFGATAIPATWGQTTYLDQGWDSDQREEFYFTAGQWRDFTDEERFALIGGDE